MSMTVMTGRAMDVKHALIERVHEAQRHGDHPILVLVPGQYTLQAEMELIGLAQQGSFRLQVLSETRLHQRIFEQAGWPSGTRIDEQGRVMLVHRAVGRLKSKLGWYKKSVGRRGFAENVLAQLEGFKQAGISPEQLAEMAIGSSGALRAKLMDLELIYRAYEEALKGQFLDGADETRAAIERMDQSPLLDGAEVFAYGFDLVSTLLSETLLALSERAKHTLLALTLDEGGRDSDLFGPVLHSYQRLHKMANERDIDIERLRLPRTHQPSAPDIRHLSQELLNIPLNPYMGKVRTIRLAQRQNPQQEAEYAAAQAREWVMTRGWRWRDIAIVCQTFDQTYEGALRRAFAQSDVPLFLPGARPADRHPVAQCLLSGLNLIAQGWRTEDMVDYLRSGFAPIEDDQADLLVNHILRRGLRGRALKSPLRITQEEFAPLEEARAAATAPLLELEERTAHQKDTALVLRAVFDFLERLDACAKLEQQQQTLIDMDQREWAMEGPQVWSRILQALDQMHELMTNEALSLRQVSELMVRSLSVAEVKPLPQSSDAVLCGSIDHMKSQQVRALMVLGLSDQSAPAQSGLLSDRDLNELNPSARLSTSLSAPDRLRMLRLNLKNALEFTDERLLLSHPSSDSKGSATKRGTLFEQVARALNRPKTVGGMDEDEDARRILLNAPNAARNRLPGLLAEHPSSPVLQALQQALGVASEPPKKDPEKLPASLADALYGDLTELSATRLEGFMACPYRHFARYALRPEIFEEFGLNPRDTGTFYHDAMELFMTENGAQLQQLTADQSMARMDRVTDQLMEQVYDRSLGEGALAEAQANELKGVARRAAATVVQQLEGSLFTPAGIEVGFGAGEPSVQLLSGAQLMGRIDRLDTWQDGNEGYLRVIDYKTGGKQLSLAEVYYGLQMQLMVYLSAALKQQGGKPAGAFYFKLSDKPIDTDARDAQQVELERMKELKLKGLVLSDKQVQQAMATQPDSVIPTRSSQVSEQDFQSLMDRTISQASDAHQQIKQGVIEIRPAELKGKSACEFCDYAVLCQRELASKPRKLAKMTDKEVLETLRNDP